LVSFLGVLGGSLYPPISHGVAFDPLVWFPGPPHPIFEFFFFGRLFWCRCPPFVISNLTFGWILDKAFSELAPLFCLEIGTRGFLS